MLPQNTVLYVDDEPINIMVFSRIFQKEFNIITSLSGFEGLEKLKSHPEIQFVFSNMKMPGMSGLEFIREASKKYQKKYFLITGYDISLEIAEAIEQKLIIKCLSKPFNISEIRNTVIF
jgi:response regulator RpfG family c-di-GMP phosphodiesterase